MRGVKLVVGAVGMGAVLLASTGCVSLDAYRRLQADNLSLIAEKEQCSADLYDCRGSAGSMRDQLSAKDRELMSKDELLDNMRRENQLLADGISRAQQEVERLANRQGLDNIPIEAKLPEPLNRALQEFAPSASHCRGL